MAAAGQTTGAGHGGRLEGYRPSYTERGQKIAAAVRVVEEAIAKLKAYQETSSLFTD